LGAVAGYVRAPSPDPATILPVDDQALAVAMRQAAAHVAEGDPRLDYSLESLDVLAKQLTPDEIRDVDAQRLCAAYLGEVLLRAAPGGRWVSGPSPMIERRRDPAIQWGWWYADPCERIRHYASDHHPDDTLLQCGRDLVPYAREPTDETAARLGWTTRRSTPWRTSTEM
jgi:hypothetical protein